MDTIEDAVKAWISKPREHPEDLITSMYYMRGFEHDIIIYIQFGNPSDFNDKTRFIDDLNIVLRTTAKLIVVSVGTKLIDPIDKTDYRSFMDADELEAHLAELNMKLSHMCNEETIRSLENIRERILKY